MENNQKFSTRFRNDKFPLYVVGVLWVALMVAAVKLFGCPVRDALWLMGLGGAASLLGVVRELVMQGSVNKEYTHAVYSIIILAAFGLTVGLFQTKTPGSDGNISLDTPGIQKIFAAIEQSTVLNEPAIIDSIWEACSTCRQDKQAFAEAVIMVDSIRLGSILHSKISRDSTLAQISGKQRQQLQQDLLRQHRASVDAKVAKTFADISFRQNLTNAINAYLQDYNARVLAQLCEDFSIDENTLLVDETFENTPVAPPDGKALSFLKGAFLYEKTMKKILVIKVSRDSTDGRLIEFFIIQK